MDSGLRLGVYKHGCGCSPISRKADWTVGVNGNDIDFIARQRRFLSLSNALISNQKPR